MSSKSFSIIMHNILGPLTRDVTSFGFEYGDYTRLDKVLHAALQTDADIICLQEFDEYVWDHLDSQLKDVLNIKYKLVAYQPKGAHGGVVIFCKKNNWHVHEHGQIQLGDKQPGACAWGLLKHSSGQLVLIVNIHLSHKANREVESEQLGKQQWDILLSGLRSIIQHEQCAVVFAGDFNTLYSEVVDTVVDYVSQQLQIPVKMYEHGSWTQNNAKGEFGALDHVLYSGLLLDEIDSWVADSGNSYVDKDRVEQAIKKEKVDKPLIYQRGYNSDHLPIYAKFNFIK